MKFLLIQPAKFYKLLAQHDPGRNAAATAARYEWQAGSWPRFFERGRFCRRFRSALNLHQRRAYRTAESANRASMCRARRMRLFLGLCFPALPSRGPVSTALLSDRPFGVRVDGTGLVDEGVAHCPIHQLPRFDSVAVKRCNGADQWRVVIVRHGLAGKMMISADIGIATASRASTVITGRGRRSTGTPTGQ